MWGQAAAEPVTLTTALMAQRAAIGRFTAFVGISWSDAVQPAHADCVSFVSYGAGGNNRALARAGCLDVLPCHYSELGRMLGDGSLRVDVLMLQVAPADAQGRHSLSLAGDYLVPALRRARVVIAEVNEQAPASCGPHALAADDIDYVVHSSRPPLEAPAAKAHPDEAGVARNVASLIEDGATLQCGIGSLPEAIVAQLSDRRDLGFHSGAMGDAAAALMQAGVINNARKTVDARISVAGVLMGTRALNRFAHRNPAIEIRGVEYTHSPAVLASIDRLVAINSAIEVDVTGQVNAEVAAGVYVGAVGGAADFLRGACASRGGLPIVALPSRSAGRKLDTIVARLNGPVSTARSDAGIVVTEHGIADLRALSLSQRVQRMIAVAHPEARDALQHEARQLGLA
ncbi:acetyl-CoA hydrolase/transferase family protein [Ramlibacter alkalitolerans]|uniref:Acetyl-CoA hydrolase/transferase family protein n=2 Tax=Ramlibacter alkalitolerans TaxID=2039631 RepID=A0ABS1JQJ1_9BURK|nr:acetyl-CoA hydrolase/transferase family protein [Ramlibacter alkalitolerans]MBL0426468.1 acetyl-CoA hydrolase/transferase family protein [Ramlibacter alkalitolerans]